MTASTAITNVIHTLDAMFGRFGILNIMSRFEDIVLGYLTLLSAAVPIQYIVYWRVRVALVYMNQH
jgi:hypothetical protein